MLISASCPKHLASRAPRFLGFPPSVGIPCQPLPEIYLLLQTDTRWSTRGSQRPPWVRASSLRVSFESLHPNISQMSASRPDLSLDPQTRICSFPLGEDPPHPKPNRVPQTCSVFRLPLVALAQTLEAILPPPFPFHPASSPSTGVVSATVIMHLDSHSSPSLSHQLVLCCWTTLLPLFPAAFRPSDLSKVDIRSCCLPAKHSPVLPGLDIIQSYLGAKPLPCVDS